MPLPFAPNNLRVKPSYSAKLNRQTRLVQGLVGGWLFNENNGDAWRDITGQHHGTTVGTGVTRQNGRFGRIVNSTGDNSTDRIDLGSVASTDGLALAGATEFTLSWRYNHRTTSSSNSFPRIFDKSDGGSAANGWALYWHDAGNNWRIDAGGDTRWSNNGPADNNQWHHMIAAYDSVNGCDFWADGDFELTDTTIFSIPSVTTNAALLNWNHTTDRNWEGWVDHLYVWDRKLTNQEILSLFRYPYQVIQPLRSIAVPQLGLEVQAPSSATGGSPVLILNYL